MTRAAQMTINDAKPMTPKANDPPPLPPSFHFEGRRKLRRAKREANDGAAK